MLYKITIAYDGTQYGGWQTQHNSICIQELIEKALSTVLRVPISVHGSGRTDAGVHAIAQVAHFEATTINKPHQALLSFNALLPLDIRILSLQEAPESFHARFSAQSKVYHYYLDINPVRNIFRRRYSYRPLQKIDISRLIKGSSYFVGTHDFFSFAHEAQKGSASQNAIRTLYRLDVVEDNDLLRLEFEGNGFLYKMVRNIVGTLLDVAQNRIEPETIPSIIKAKNRSLAGQTAPPHGLFLAKVNYD
jgi:tRNA pseudouridine38-40 synthase